jgi:pheromone shutdown protein TraB
MSASVYDTCDISFLSLFLVFIDAVFGYVQLQRAWEGLGWLEKLKLGTVLWSGISSTKLDLSEESMQVWA